MFLADVGLVRMEYSSSVRINEVLQKLNIPITSITAFLFSGDVQSISPVVNDQVLVPTNGTRTSSGDSILSDARLSGFQRQSLTFKVPPVLRPYGILSIRCFKCHTFCIV